MHEYKAKVIKVVDGDTIDVDLDLGFGIWLRNERVRTNKWDQFDWRSWKNAWGQTRRNTNPEELIISCKNNSK